MATIYVPPLPPLSTEALQQATRPEAIPYYARLPSPLQAALRFGWQWFHGHERFSVPTSGSTGATKTIEVTRQQMLVSVRLTQQALGLTARHMALLCIHPDFIGGKMMLARGFHIGMDMVWVPPAANPLQHLAHRPDFIAMVPLQLQTVLEEAPALLEGVHAILVGGAPVSLALEEAIRAQIASPVYSTYGMTETLSHVALRRLNGPEASLNFEVLGDTHISTDERGCLVIRGEITRYEPVVTNDVIALVDDRRFRWQGRYDWVINSGGVKVSPERVEQVVERQWAVRKPMPRFFVTGVPDERLGERVVLVIESAAAAAEEQQRLLQALAAELPRYHAPKEIRYMRTFRETGSGKIDRKATMGC